ncbi:hypothetical protein, partial [Streptomyces sp. S.PNR 29]|uniref:hypothetical protein n=1 Tax=Streptomyces sp. S.PNR 29 TaxID=2973805 RepID=UPI0025B23A12
MAVATPPTTGTATVALPSPKSNVTVPVGDPPPGATGATVAVNVTCSPTTDGSGLDVTVVVVPAAVTVWVSVPVEPVKSPSPPYVA